MRQPEKPVTLADRADRSFVTISEDMPLLDVMIRLRAAGASVALVTDGTDKVSGVGVHGLITKQQIARAVADVTLPFRLDVRPYPESERAGLWLQIHLCSQAP